MAFWVYMLRCADGSYYTGHTDNLELRIGQHQQGDIRSYTSTRRPVELIYSEHFSSRVDALERERQVKGWSRRKKEALMRGKWQEVSQLARKNFSAPKVVHLNPDVAAKPVIHASI